MSFIDDDDGEEKRRRNQGQWRDPERPVSEQQIQNWQMRPQQAPAPKTPEERALKETERMMRPEMEAAGFSNPIAYVAHLGARRSSDPREARMQEMFRREVVPGAAAGGRRDGAAGDERGQFVQVQNKQEGRGQDRLGQAAGTAHGQRRDTLQPTSLRNPAAPEDGLSEPLLRRDAERRQSILKGAPGRISIAANPNAQDRAPAYAEHSEGWQAVHENHKAIAEIAEEENVDPDLIRAIMYVENAQGHYFGLSSLLDTFGESESVMPMNIRPNFWRPLLPEIGGDERLDNPRNNIRAAARLLRGIQERVGTTDIDRIATLYNEGGATRVNDYGARVARVYREKFWAQQPKRYMVP